MDKDTAEKIELAAVYKQIQDDPKFKIFCEQINLLRQDMIDDLIHNKFDKPSYDNQLKGAIGILDTLIDHVPSVINRGDELIQNDKENPSSDED